MKRTAPLKRTAFKRREGPSLSREVKPRAEKSPAAKKCRMCPREFIPRNSLHVLCGPLCANKYARQLEKDRQAKEKAERATDRAKREAIKTLPELIEEAQAAVNEYVRLRDARQPCICCGKPFEPGKPGGSMDAGHFRSRSSAPHLRFNTDNIFGQRKNCNRPGGTTYAAFRAGVLARIGAERLAAIENDHQVHKWTREEVRGIRDTYRTKVRELNKEKAK